MTLEQIIGKTQGAINDSGKSFDKIPKDTITDFLKSAGIGNKEQREQVYQRLKDMNTKAPVVKMGGVEANDTANNSIPVKQPRKSIFGEIKRVA